MYWKINKFYVYIPIILVFTFTIVMACAVTKKGNDNNQCDTKNSGIIGKLESKIAKKTATDMLYTLCDIDHYDTSRILGDIEILYLKNKYNCPCKTVYLKNRKETLFCLDYFLDFPERIKVYNEFISNSGIKINNQDMAEEYVKTLVSLSNLYVIKSFSKGDVSNKLFTNRSCYHIRALIIRNVAIDPINFELDEKAFDLNIKVDNKGKMAIEENK